MELTSRMALPVLQEPKTSLNGPDLLYVVPRLSDKLARLCYLERKKDADWKIPQNIAAE